MGAKKIRLRPIYPEAMQWDGESLTKFCEFYSRDYPRFFHYDKRLEYSYNIGEQPNPEQEAKRMPYYANSTIYLGDWIVRHPDGRYSRIGREEFRDKYEVVPE